MKTLQKVLEPLGIKKLSNTEMQFMEVIWEHPDGIKSEELYAKFSQALGTKSTILHRIAGKGLVTAVRSILWKDEAAAGSFIFRGSCVCAGRRRFIQQDAS